jgi:COMPASS component SWD2
MESLDYIDEEPSFAMGMCNSFNFFQFLFYIILKNYISFLGAVVHGEGAVSNLEYHKDGQYLVMTTNESSIHLIDSLNGIEKKKLYAKTGGIGRLQYTHHESGILLSNSDKNKNNNFDIRYLCMYDNRYLRYFKGHTEKVTSMSMSPIDDNFLSATDKSVLLWNLSTPNPIAALQLPPYYQNSYVSYDVGGVIFGVMSYDTR